MTLGGTAATGVTVTPPNTINATTGAHAAGLVNVVVTNPDSQSGTLTNGYTYTAPPPAPTITSFSPTSGAVGASVTINGTNFTGATAVKFNGTSASFTVNTSIKITATVPAGATTGRISVTTPGGTATSANNFTVKHHASFTSDAAAVHLEAGLAHPGGIELMQMSEAEGRLPVERIASLGLWRRDTEYPATGLTLSNVVLLSARPRASSDSGLGRMAQDVDLQPEEVSSVGAVAESAVKPQAISTLGRRYSFYSPEMNLLAETEIRTTSGTPGVLYEYVWFNGHPVAQVDSGTTTHWTFTDHLGTPLIQTDTPGAVYWRAEHEPYGKVFSLRTADQHQPLRLPGQEAEQLNLGQNGATERSYNIFRWYRPSWGRYTQADPIGTGSGTTAHTNLFAYVLGNPLAYSDPLGLAAEVCCRPALVSWDPLAKHCFIRVDGHTYSLFPEKIPCGGRGLPSPDDNADLQRKPQETCSICRAKPCSQIDGSHRQCFDYASQTYPIGKYHCGGPNSNTFAAYMANTCCAGGFPQGMGPTPGHDSPLPTPMPIRPK